VNTFNQKFNEIVAYKADELINNRRGEIEILQAPATAVSPGSVGRVIYYKVKSGQTLSDIAAKYGISVNKLKKWNNIRRSHIRTGTRLKIIK